MGLAGRIQNENQLFTAAVQAIVQPMLPFIPGKL